MAQESFGKLILEEVKRLAAKVGVNDTRDGQEDKESLNKRLGRLEKKVTTMLIMMEGEQKDDIG